MKALILGNHEVVVYNFRKELVHRLLSEGHEVVVSYPAGKHTQYFKEIGCQFENITVDRHSKNPFRDLKLFFQYLKMIKRVKPEVILTYTIKPNIWGGLAANLFRIPYIVNITGMGTALETPGLVQFVTRNLYRLSMSRVHRIFFQNQSNLDFFQKSKIGKEKHSLIPGSGVDLAHYSPQPFPSEADGTIRLLFIGRIKKDKGIEEYLEVAKRYSNTPNKLEFGVLGFFDGDYEKEIQELSELNVIKYLGVSDDVRPFIAQAQAIILPSFYEGMANVLLEAAAMARPVIASDIPGCAETFQDGITGFSCTPGDADSLESAIESFLRLSSDKRSHAGKLGREWVASKFSRDIIVDTYLAEIGKIS